LAELDVTVSHTALHVQPQWHFALCNAALCRNTWVSTELAGFRAGWMKVGTVPF